MPKFHDLPSPEAVRFEHLEPRKLLSATLVHQPLDVGVDYTPLIVAGDPNGSPADSPANRVDPNTTTSPYGGVGSVYMQTSSGGYIGSAAAISRIHILTAGHNVDISGDGIVDVATSNFSFILNFGGSYSDEIYAKAIHLHPDYTGFSNPVVNDDLAIVELSRPLPEGVPIYPLYDTPFTAAERITMVGYGTSGDGVNGYYVNPRFDVKRVGYQMADAYEVDDEGSGSREVFEFDFDGAGINRWGGGSLGNDVESHIGGGDSGGPSFVTDANGNLSLFGVNTYSFGYFRTAAPYFGSGGGGMVISAYVDWINGILGNGTNDGGSSDGDDGGTVNTAPTASDDSATANKQGRVTLNVLANDTDPDGDALTVIDLIQPANGTVTVASNGDVTYTANKGFSGVDTFTYQASDGELASNVGTVSVTVGGNGGNDGGGKGGGTGKGGPKSERLSSILIAHAGLARPTQLSSLFSDTGIANSVAAADEQGPLARPNV